VARAQGAGEEEEVASIGKRVSGKKTIAKQDYTRRSQPAGMTLMEWHHVDGENPST
jgi:hypothetical protein